MATLSKPLISAAALASAAAVAVATPAIVPSVGVPTPGALSKAAYELATFSDVLSIPPVVWTDILFGNDSWGGTLSATTYGPAWAEPQDEFGQVGYVNPWAVYCTAGNGTGKCDISGIPGVSYMFWDALINGNGNGYDDYQNWPVSFVNYFAEPAGFFLLGGGNSPILQYNNLGYSAGLWYTLQGTLEQLSPDLAAQLRVPLAGAFWGPANLSVFYNLGLQVTAALVAAVPLVGPVTSNTILAYLGDLPIEGTEDYYQYGLSGALNYWIDLATGAVPFPTGTAAPAAAVEAPASVVAATVVDEAPAATVADEAPAETVADEAPAAPSEAPAAPSEAPAPTIADEGTAAEDAAESAPAVDADPAAPSADDAAVADDATVADELEAADDAAVTDEVEAADDAVAADEVEAADDAVAADDLEAAADASDSAPADDAPAKGSDDGAGEKDGAAASSSASDAGAADSDSADSAS